ncbi:helix-turn-helix domain-containing protein [Paenibacillus sp. QZ-Y1]|uniref:helix-turn-helix domain-containing protein n=1 Tax=Paenibacillus sp. QZ-Y1 TaxID=3414511 RepID=UPI003F7A0FD4
MSNEPTKEQLQSTMDNLMFQLMTTEEAAERWVLSQDHVKRLCSSHTIIAHKRGKTWLILREQPNPKQK